MYSYFHLVPNEEVIVSTWIFVSHGTNVIFYMALIIWCPSNPQIANQSTRYIFPLWPSNFSTINLVMFLKFHWLIFFWNYDENVSTWKYLFSAVLKAHKFLNVENHQPPSWSINMLHNVSGLFLKLMHPFLDIILPFLQCYIEKDHDLIWWRHFGFELSKGC